MLKDMLIKYRSFILYAFFGVCTTLVNIIVYYICSYVLNLSTIISTAISWFLAVLFAYVTNREWVFESHVSNTKEVTKEITSFFSCRLLTGLLDIGIMYICVDILNWNDMIIKMTSNILVIVLNYVASKLIIFK